MCTGNGNDDCRVVSYDPSEVKLTFLNRCVIFCLKKKRLKRLTNKLKLRHNGFPPFLGKIHSYEPAVLYQWNALFHFKPLQCQNLLFFEEKLVGGSWGSNIRKNSYLRDACRRITTLRNLRFINANQLKSALV